MKQPSHAVRQSINGLATLLRRRHDFIIHIGNVTHIGHPLIEMTQQAHQHIKHHHRTTIANVCAVIHRGATHIDTHMGIIQWHKNLFFTAQLIVQPQHHDSFAA